MGFQSKNETVSFSCEIRHETKAAYLVSDDGVREIWIPKSQVIIMSTEEGCSVLEIPEWLAIEKEVI